MERPRFSLRVNNDLPPSQLLALGTAAEEAGFEQLWVSNDLMLRSAPALLGALAERTGTMTLGIGIMNPYTVHPAELAMIAATLAELSGGRFALGLAAGAAEFLGWVGIEQSAPLATTRRAVRAVRALLAGETPGEDAGPGWSAAARLGFDAPPVPLYLGATGPRMLELAGAEADGVLALTLPPSSYPTIAERVHHGAVAAGRDPAAVDLPACVWLSLDDDPVRARRALADKVAYYGAAFSPSLLSRLDLTVADFAEIDRHVRAGDAAGAAALVTDTMLGLGIWGDAEAIVDRCRRLLDDGVSHLSFGPPLGPDPVAAVTRLGIDVLPSLRDCPRVPS